MGFNYSLLKAKISVKGYTIQELAEKTGIGYHSLLSKLDGAFPFKDYEIYKLKQVLNLDSIEKYFFETVA